MRLLLLLISIHVACSTKWSRPPTFVIDLDKPAGERWKAVAKAYGENVRVGYKTFENMVGVLNKDKFDKILELGKRFPGHYYEEVVGFAKYANMSVTQGVLLQFIYDLTITCTSIVCVDDKNEIWHLRDLDYTPTAPLKGITINVDFHARGRSIYKGTTFAGMVGLLTGVKKQGFSISLNQRILNESFQKNVLSTVTQVKTTGHTWPVSILMRDMLSRNGMNYKKAVAVFSKFPLIAPCYLIIGGQKANEGTVLIRSREGVDAERRLDGKKNRWFVLMPNSDLKFENMRYVRSFAAMQLMTQKGVTKKNMFLVLITSSQKSTVYAAIMSAKSYTLDSVVPRIEFVEEK